MLLLLVFNTEQEKEEFRCLYEKYADHMLRVARHILSNGSDIEDVVHDAFLYVAKNLSKIDCSDHKKNKSIPHCNYKKQSHRSLKTYSKRGSLCRSGRYSPGRYELGIE